MFTHTPGLSERQLSILSCLQAGFSAHHVLVISVQIPWLMYSTPYSCLLLSFGVFWQNDSCSIHKLHSAEGRLNKTRRCVGESFVGIENQISQRFLLTCAPTKVYEGKVVERGDGEVPDCKIDCSGLLVAPGLIDLQVCAITEFRGFQGCCNISIKSYLY